MLHVVRQVQRHFPGREPTVLRAFVIASASLLAVGIGILVLA